MKFGKHGRHKLFLVRLLPMRHHGMGGCCLRRCYAGAGTGRFSSQEAASGARSARSGPEELRKLVAPIALYPDELLAVVLPASTNPLQIVQAQRYLDKRKADQKLQPDANWDPSVLALLNYPEVVSKMNDDLQWTEDLGNAVIDQQKDIMDMIQQVDRKLMPAAT